MNAAPQEDFLANLGPDLVDGLLTVGKKEYTGRSIANDVARAEVVDRLLALGVGKAKIAQAVGASINTIIAYASNHPEKVEAAKKRLAPKLALMVDVLADRVIELLPAMKPGEASMAFGILFDKLQLVEGRATSIVERRDGARITDFSSLISGLPVIDVHAEPITGFDGGSVFAKGPGDAAAMGAELGGAAEQVMSNHLVSPANALCDPRRDPRELKSAGDSGAAAAAIDQDAAVQGGGRGSARVAGGAVIKPEREGVNFLQ